MEIIDRWTEELTCCPLLSLLDKIFAWYRPLCCLCRAAAASARKVTHCCTGEPSCSVLDVGITRRSGQLLPGRLQGRRELMISQRGGHISLARGFPPAGLALLA